MNFENREDKPCCYFHPKQVLIGVCPLCLNERLVILAAKQGHVSLPEGIYRNLSAKQRKPSLTLPKIFALGSLLKHNKQFDYSHSDSSRSPEDSFISIKFEDNGVGSWEKSTTVSKVSLDHCNISWNNNNNNNNHKEAKSVVAIENAKPRSGGSLRWRKRIGHLFQLSRWRRPTTTKTKVVEGVKLRSSSSGWISLRTLTKRRTKE
ncbi:uncharacterized protein LOC130776635 [Actinidia eriantha]|uniref:uncharacterized protein LOC130776635 n=1 Tax=Actinidia eriantha TaxID=165200 RepID=UPI002582F93C|nr:uncharacterized protein LOC130776635 [Actinidia eriantha]